jgi:hypothetical protein
MTAQTYTSLCVVLFLMAATVGNATGQEPFKRLMVSVESPNGPISNAIVTFDQQREFNRRYDSKRLSQPGPVPFFLRFGRYNITIEGECSSRILEMDVDSDTQETLTLTLPTENCEEVRKMEAVEWSVCREKSVVVDFEISEQDKIEIINNVIEWKVASMARGRSLSADRDSLTISTENIQPTWITPKRGVTIKLITPDVVRGMAKRGTDVYYYVVSELSRRGSCVTGSLSRRFEKGKGSRVVYFCSTGEDLGFMFRRDILQNIWIGKSFDRWPEI